VKEIKYIGIASSILLIANYLIIGPAISLNFDTVWFYVYLYYHNIFTVPIAFIGFYIALFQKIRLSQKGIFPNLIEAIIGLKFLLLIFGLIRFFGFNFPEILISIANFTVMIFFIIWAIKVIKSTIPEFKIMRSFAISIVIAHLIFIFTGLFQIVRPLICNCDSNSFEYMNLILAVYGIGYIFGLLIFINKKINTSS